MATKRHSSSNILAAKQTISPKKAKTSSKKTGSEEFGSKSRVREYLEENQSTVGKKVPAQKRKKNGGTMIQEQHELINKMKQTGVVQIRKARVTDDENSNEESPPKRRNGTKAKVVSAAPPTKRKVNADKKKSELGNQKYDQIKHPDGIEVEVENLSDSDDQNKGPRIKKTISSKQFEDIAGPSCDRKSIVLTDESDSESDWEEVAELPEKDLDEDREPIIPKEGVEITLEVPGFMRKKKKKKKDEFDLRAYFVRRMNKFKKNSQLNCHKVHLLCLLCHGFYANRLVMADEIKALCFSLLPPEILDKNPNTATIFEVQAVVYWYRKTFSYQGKLPALVKKPLLNVEGLALCISCKACRTVEEYVVVFVSILRTLGFQTRLIFSWQPITPKATGLLKQFKEKGNTDDDGDWMEKILKLRDMEMKHHYAKSLEPVLKKEQEEVVSFKIKDEDEATFSCNPCTGVIQHKDDNSAEKTLNTLKVKEIKVSSKQNVEHNKIPQSSKPSDKLSQKKGTSTVDVIGASCSKIEANTTPKISRKIKGSKQNVSHCKFTPKSRPLGKASRSNALSQVGEAISVTKCTKLAATTRMKANCQQKDKPTQDVKAKTKPSSKAHGNLKDSKLSAGCSVKIPVTKMSSPAEKISGKLNACRNKVVDTPKNIGTKNKNKTGSCNIVRVSNDVDVKPLENASKNVKVKYSKKAGKEDINKAGSSSEPTVSREASKKPLRVLRKRSVDKKNIHDDPTDESENDEEMPLPQTSKGRIIKSKKTSKGESKKSSKKSQTQTDESYKTSIDSDSDFEELPLPRRPSNSRKNQAEVKSKSGKQVIDFWAEVYLPLLKKWVCVDPCIQPKASCENEMEGQATQPVQYVVGFDNEGCVKDVTGRYVKNWMSQQRKMRADIVWWEDTLSSFRSRNKQRNREEDEQIEQFHQTLPLPKTIGEYKNHPLYALPRHLLKFESLYPPDTVPVGYFRNEPVYARDCVQTLYSRETWLKEAKVVKLGELPYKVVTGRPKWNKVMHEIEKGKPLEVFGFWQIEDYDPPTAENGKVPRNEYGNVELFKPCMLPKGTVQLRLSGLNRIARKLGLDCAQAMIGWDYNMRGTFPVFDGWVVCEEYKDVLTDAWREEQVNAEKREIEKREKRVYGAWRRIIRGLLIRERLKLQYLSDDVGHTSQTTDDNDVKQQESQ